MADFSPAVARRVEDAIARAQREILADVADGRVPAGVRSFAELHDHVDANEYGGLCDDPWWVGRAAAAPAACEAVQGRLDAWLRDGRPGVVEVWDDLHAEKAGFFRAFEVTYPGDSSGCPVVGYCSPGGSFRTVAACAADAARRRPGTPVYRDGRRIR